MTATLNQNGRSRKTLANQIDRLDNILDGLADALNEAVTAAVKSAVTQAIQVAVREVLTNEMLRQALGVQNQAQQQPAKPSPLKRATTTVLGLGRWLLGVGLSAGAKLASVGRRLRSGTGKVVASIGNVVRTRAASIYYPIAATIQLGWVYTLTLLYLVRQLRRQGLVALTVGLVTGMGCYLAGPIVASAVGGVNCMVLTLLVLSLRRFWLADEVRNEFADASA
jgi:hypothetical protein